MESTQVQVGYAPQFKVKLPSGECVEVGPDSGIRFLQSNPKRPGSLAHENYERYKGATTILELACLQGKDRSKAQVKTDLQFDVKGGFAELLGPFKAAEAEAKCRPKKNQEVLLATQDAAQEEKTAEEKDAEQGGHAGTGGSSKKGARRNLMRPRQDVESKASHKPAALLARELAEKQEMEKLHAALSEKRKRGRASGTKSDAPVPKALPERSRSRDRTSAGTRPIATGSTEDTSAMHDLTVPVGVQDAAALVTSSAGSTTTGGSSPPLDAPCGSLHASVDMEHFLRQPAVDAPTQDPPPLVLLEEMLGSEGAAAFMAFAMGLGVVLPASNVSPAASPEEKAKRAWEAKLKGAIALSESHADRACAEVLSRARSGTPFAPHLPVMTLEEARVVLLRCGGKDALNRERARRLGAL